MHIVNGLMRVISNDPHSLFSYVVNIKHMYKASIRSKVFTKHTRKAASVTHMQNDSG